MNENLQLLGKDKIVADYIKQQQIVSLFFSPGNKLLVICSLISNPDLQCTRDLALAALEIS